MNTKSTSVLGVSLVSSLPLIPVLLVIYADGNTLWESFAFKIKYLLCALDLYYLLPALIHSLLYISMCIWRSSFRETARRICVQMKRFITKIVLCDCKSWVSLTLVGQAIRKAGWKLSGRCWCCWNVCFLRENSFLYLKPLKGLNKFHPDNPG